MSEEYSRRKVLASLAALGGTSVLYITSRPTKGQETDIQFGELNIPDPEYQLGDKDITSVSLSVDANYRWDSSHTPDKATLTLLVGDSEDTLSEIDTKELTDLEKDQAGTETLKGSVTETYMYAVQDFQPSNGGTKSTRLVAGLQIELIKDGEVYAENQITELVSVSVDGTELSATAELAGSGEVLINE